eukprot:m.85440 g.85440  ORF g.85440 m.85440 type:complete len:305 (+) comp15053_c3_seq1:46-960(+)
MGATLEKTTTMRARSGVRIGSGEENKQTEERRGGQRMQNIKQSNTHPEKGSRDCSCRTQNIKQSSAQRRFDRSAQHLLGLLLVARKLQLVENHNPVLLVLDELGKRLQDFELVRRAVGCAQGCRDVRRLENAARPRIGVRNDDRRLSPVGAEGQLGEDVGKLLRGEDGARGRRKVLADGLDLVRGHRRRIHGREEALRRRVCQVAGPVVRAVAHLIVLLGVEGHRLAIALPSIAILLLLLLWRHLLLRRLAVRVALTLTLTLTLTLALTHTCASERLERRCAERAGLRVLRRLWLVSARRRLQR